MAIYRKIYPRIWQSLNGLSTVEKAIALYILCGPQTNRCGIYLFSIGKAIEDLETLPQTFAKGFERVLQNLSWRYDKTFRVIYIPTWWKWNPPENPNVLKGNLTDIDELPKTPLLSDFYANTQHLSDNLILTFTQTLPQTLPQTQAKSETETETETETEVRTAPQPPAELSAPTELQQIFSCQYFSVDPNYWDELQTDFPGLTQPQILEELKKARDWCIDNAKAKRKLKASGQLANQRLFLRNWFNRAMSMPDKGNGGVASDDACCNHPKKRGVATFEGHWYCRSCLDQIEKKQFAGLDGRIKQLTGKMSMEDFNV